MYVFFRYLMCHHGQFVEESCFNGHKYNPEVGLCSTIRFCTFFTFSLSDRTLWSILSMQGQTQHRLLWRWNASSRTTPHLRPIRSLYWREIPPSTLSLRNDIWSKPKKMCSRTLSPRRVPRTSRRPWRRPQRWARSPRQRTSRAWSSWREVQSEYFTFQLLFLSIYKVLVVRNTGALFKIRYFKFTYCFRSLPESMASAPMVKPASNIFLFFYISYL